MPASLAKCGAADSVERPRTRNSRDWTSRPSAQRLLQLVDVILPERVLGERREASRSGGRAGGGQAEVAEDPLDHRLLVDEGDDLAASAAWAGENVLTEDAQEELAPGNARIEGSRRFGRGREAGRVWPVARTGGFCGARPLRGRWHDLTAPLRGRSEDAVVAHEVSPRRRDQRRETADQLARLEDEDIAAVAEAPLHAVVTSKKRPLIRFPGLGATSRWAEGHRRRSPHPASLVLLAPRDAGRTRPGDPRASRSRRPDDNDALHAPV